MSRIYHGGSAESRYRQTDLGQSYRPQRAASSEKAAKEWKQQVIADGDTKIRDLQRKSQAESLESRLTMQVETAGLKTQQLTEQIELEMDQQYSRDVLKQQQTHESLEMKMDAAELQAQNQVQNANTAAMRGAVQGILSFAGSAIQFADTADKRLKTIASGEWALSDPDYSISTPEGKAVVEAEQNQDLVEIAEETAISNTELNPVDREILRERIGVPQTDARIKRQIDLGEASASISGRLATAFNDPNRTIVILGADGQAKRIRPMDATPGELFNAIRTLGVDLTKEMGVRNADRYTAVTQYVPRLEAAINRLYAQEAGPRTAAANANRQSLGFTKAAQILTTGNIAEAWAAYYKAAATSGIYNGDVVKITTAAVEAMVQDATLGQMKQLQEGSIRVFDKGPTFANDRRFQGLIKQAIRDKNKGLIDDNYQKERLQEIELSNATNSFQEALMNADNPEATEAAHLEYEANLESLAAAGNGKARLELAEQISNRDNANNNYNPKYGADLRARVTAGETFTEEFLLNEYASGRINTTDYNDLKRSGLATPEQRARVYGGKEARNASNARSKSIVSQTLINGNAFLKNASTDIMNGIVSNISQDINKRRDTAVNSYYASILEETGKPLALEMFRSLPIPGYNRISLISSKVSRLIRIRASSVVTHTWAKHPNSVLHNSPAFALKIPMVLHIRLWTIHLFLTGS